LKVVDINKGKNKLERELEAFRKSLQLEDFLSAVESCLKNQIYETSVFATEDKVFSEVAFTESSFDVFSIFLSKLSVYYPTLSGEKAAFTHTNVSTFIELYEDFKTLQNEFDGFDDQYSFFSQSIFMKNYLENAYPEDIDPGRIIALYLKVIFPNKFSQKLEQYTTDYTFNPVYKLVYGSQLHKLIKQVGELLCSQMVLEPEKKSYIVNCRNCLNEYLDPENCDGRSIDHIEPIKLFADLLEMPCDFYYAWINEVLLNAGSEFSASSDRLVAALNCLPIGKGNNPLIYDPSIYYSCDDSIQERFNKLRPSMCKIRETIYLSFSDFFRIIDLGVLYDCDDNIECVLKTVNANLTTYRLEYLSGIAPFDSECYYEAGILLDVVGLEEIDLMLLLCRGKSFESDFTLFPEDNSSYYTKSDFFNKRQKIYLAAFEKSIAEGFSELGVALISLYIFSRAIIMNCRFGLLPALISAVERALTLPGAKILKHTISFVVESTDKYYSDDPLAVASAMYFKKLLPQTAELHVIEGAAKSSFGRVNNEADITAFFENELGSDRWGKLSENSRSCLVSAELQWRNSAVEFGFGIKDWSGLITTYCKAIEGELVGRLTEFYGSDEYLSHLEGKGLKRPTKATAGWLLKELRGYEAMPPQLQSVLHNAKIRLAGERDIVNRLYDVVQNYRNISAHHNAVSMKHYAEFKQKMFQSGLLQQFIDAFVE